MIRLISTRFPIVAALLAIATIPATMQAQGDYSWGFNGYGQLGNNSFANSSVPVAIVGQFNGVTAISGGGNHSLSVVNGSAFAWGNNLYGQLGNGTNGSSAGSNVPVAVQGLNSGVTAVSAGYAHSLAIQNGAAFAWGDNSQGALGNGTGGNGSAAISSVPVAVQGLSSGVTMVSGGLSHSLAIQNGAAYTWGYNTFGQLGNNSNAGSNVPVPVQGLSSGVTMVSGGQYHSLAICNGAALAWGYNAQGELGNGTTSGSNVPVAVQGLSSGVTAVSGGYYHSLAVVNGSVFSWGYNVNGQIGNNTTTASTIPIQVGGALSGLTVAQVAASESTSLALTVDHRLFAWGDNSQGQFGNGTTTSSLMPVEVLATNGLMFSSLDAGDRFAIVVMTPLPEPALFLAVGVVGMAVVRSHGKYRGQGLPACVLKPSAHSKGSHSVF